MWYRFESKKRNMTIFILGLIYFEGRYVQKDIRKCIHYFKLASDQNYSNAQNFLGFIYSDKKYNIILILEKLFIIIHYQRIKINHNEIEIH